MSSTTIPNGRASPSATTLRRNYRKRYYKGELPRKNTFEGRKLISEPKFIQKRRQLADSKDTYGDVSTFEKEIPEKS